MRGGRILVIIGIIVLVGALGVGGLLWIRGRQTTSVPEGAALEEGEAEPYIPLEGTVVVAAQNIQRGTTLTSDSVRLAPWPEDAVPNGALTAVEEVEDRIARVDIVLDMPVLESMITEVPGDLVSVGSDVALQIPPGKVAYALAVSSNSSVAWAIQPGDHVDVIASLLVAELDEEFQTSMPNSAACVQPPEGDECQGGVLGRLEVLPNGWVVNLTPTGDQRPRIVTQLTIQDAMVLRIGDWPVVDGVVVPEEQVPEETVGAEGEPVVPARAAVEMMTVVVTPQDAMVIKYMEELGASIDFVLRSAGDVEEFSTSSVTLQYVFDRFNIELPPKLPYGVEPPPGELRPGAAGEVGAGGGAGGEAVGE